MSAAPSAAAARGPLRQLVVGLVALPLTALPFVGYMNLTPEGRLVRDRAIVALAPPSLPTLAPAMAQAAADRAPRYDGAVMALAYHGIGSASDSEGGFVVSAKRFGEHLAVLAAAGMHTVTASQVAAAFTGGPPLPPNAVMISFDDGRSDAMMFADPLLKEAGMSATMFVIAGAASDPGIYYASWDRIESYARSGRWDIESHSAEAHRMQKTDDGQSLPALTSLAPGESLDDYRARIRDDLAQANAAIEEHVGHAPVAFAYPFGAYGADRSNDPSILDVLHEEVAADYTVAFQQDDQSTVPLLTADQDLLRLRRVEVQNWSGLELLGRIGRAANPDAGNLDDAPADPAELALPAPPTVTAPPAAPPAMDGPAPAAGPPAATHDRTTPTARPATSRASASPAAGILPPLAVTATIPPVTVALPPLTVPPLTVPPLPVVTTIPPTTTTPTTKPPPTTTTSTTVCQPRGNSRKCG